jgi:hypothetical protein
VLVGFLGLLAWRAPGQREPFYEGRPLSRWLDHHVPSTAADPPYNSPGWKKAEEALRHIGTNGIPTLLKMISARDLPPILIQIREKAQRWRLARSRYQYAMSRHEEAEYAFQVLGATASNAVPGLMAIYQRNISPSSQRCAALALGHIGPGARAALPVLFRDFTHTNPHVRFYAVSAVMNIGGDPEVVVPKLTMALQDSNINVRWNALSGLSRFFARARPAVPEIQKLLGDQGKVGASPIREQVEIALWRIAPEKVGWPVVVEEATPMITNGLTSQAIKMLLLGELKTLIPPAKPLPTVAQYWNSDPRPRLTLYRGDPASRDKDHLLGHFEVLDLPAAPDLNISTLCIVADGRIYLSARDNQQDRFLQIRRVEE